MSSEQPGSERLAVVVEAVTSALRDVITVHHLTDDEWHAALRFLTEVGQADEFILLSDVMQLSVLVDELSHPDTGAVTSSDVLGPFWRPAPLLDNPGRLVPEDEPGEHLVLSGSVRTAGGEPIEGAELDFWQCSAEGLYDVQLPGDEPRYRGRLRTGPGHLRHRAAGLSPKLCCKTHACGAFRNKEISVANWALSDRCATGDSPTGRPNRAAISRTAWTTYSLDTWTSPRARPGRSTVHTTKPSARQGPQVVPRPAPRRARGRSVDEEHRLRPGARGRGARQ